MINQSEYRYLYDLMIKQEINSNAALSNLKNEVYFSFLTENIHRFEFASNFYNFPAYVISQKNVFPSFLKTRFLGYVHSKEKRINMCSEK